MADVRPGGLMMGWWECERWWRWWLGGATSADSLRERTNPDRVRRSCKKGVAWACDHSTAVCPTGLGCSRVRALEGERLAIAAKLDVAAAFRDWMLID